MAKYTGQRGYYGELHLPLELFQSVIGSGGIGLTRTGGPVVQCRYSSAWPLTPFNLTLERSSLSPGSAGNGLKQNLVPLGCGSCRLEMPFGTVHFNVGVVPVRRRVL